MGLPHPLPRPFSPGSSLPAPLNEACPSPHTRDLGLARRPAALPPAEPGLTNFGLPARLAPSSAPPLGLSGTGPLLPSLVDLSNPIAEAEARLCSQTSSSPLPSASAPALRAPSARYLRLRLPRRAQACVEQTNSRSSTKPSCPSSSSSSPWGGDPGQWHNYAYHQGWAVCARIRQSSGERRAFFGVVTNEDEPGTGQACP